MRSAACPLAYASIGASRHRNGIEMAPIKTSDTCFCEERRADVVVKHDVVRSRLFIARTQKLDWSRQWQDFYIPSRSTQNARVNIKANKHQTYIAFIYRMSYYDLRPAHGHNNKANIIFVTTCCDKIKQFLCGTRLCIFLHKPLHTVPQYVKVDLSRLCPNSSAAYL